ncbi:hypothetical protein ACA30_13480 [Virgibacillus soli]|nr:hypothetical protein ACA30_13480 [Virgibacillus soli]
MKKIIEWFLKKAFPVILKLLIVYSEDIVRNLIKVIFKFMSEREKKKAQENFHIAKSMLDEAEKASTVEERNRFLFEAEFYKRQAESATKEIQELAKEFAIIEEKTVKLVKESTSKMKAEDLFELNKADESIELKEKKNYIQVNDNKNLGLE